MNGDRACTATFDSTIAPPIFADVPAGHWAHDFIESACVAGVTAGCGEGNFCPDDYVTRGQMAVFIEAALGNPPNVATGRFIDVPADHPFAGYLEKLEDDGITGGCGGGQFLPDKPVTRAEMAVFIVAAPPPFK
jgi:hypothetical protein